MTLIAFVLAFLVAFPCVYIHGEARKSYGARRF